MQTVQPAQPMPSSSRDSLSLFIFPSLLFLLSSCYLSFSPWSSMIVRGNLQVPTWKHCSSSSKWKPPFVMETRLRMRHIKVWHCSSPMQTMPGKWVSKKKRENARLSGNKNREKARDNRGLAGIHDFKLL